MIVRAVENGVRRHKTLLAIGCMMLVTGLGFAALHHLLAEMHVQDFRTAFHAISPSLIALSVGMTILSYLALTLYDHIALVGMGRPLRWRTVALASFCSYTLSHNLGLSLLTGGSARLRIYGAAGLRPSETARIILSAGLAFWGGVVTMAALLMAFHPIALDLWGLTLAMPLQRVFGVALLIGIAMLLLMLGQECRPIRLFGWMLALPTRRQAAGQIGVACIDLMAASAALFILVPQASIGLYPAFFLGYALAIILTLVSHVPGGIGLFEAVMLAALPQVDRPSLLAALLVYRAIYYVIPLIVAIVMIAVHESLAWRKPASRMLDGAEMLLREIAPTLLAVLVAVGGIVLLVSGSLPAEPERLRALNALVPMPFLEASHLAASVVGAVLILLASGLYRRLDGAFWLTRLLLVSGAIFSLMKGLDYEEAIVLIIIACLLQLSRTAFYRRTSFTTAIFSPEWVATLGVAVGISIWIGFFAYRHVDYQNDLWWQFGRHHDASRFLRAALATGVLAIGVAIRSMLRPASIGALMATEAPLPSAEALALASRTDACLALTGDKHLLVSPSGRAFLMYQVQGHSWIVMGDPVGDPGEWSDLLWQMRERVDAAQGRLLIYQLSMDSLSLAIDLGLSIVKYGEEARVDLSRFTLDGPEARPLRHAVRRAEREGACFEIVPAEEVPALIPQLQAISDHWLAAKGATEKGFSVGRFDLSYLRHFDCALVRCRGEIVAFANIWTTPDKRELSVDLMRHSDGIPYGVMDFMFARLMQWGEAEGYRWFALGLAPLSGLEARRLASPWAKAGAFLYRHGGGFYGFEGLRAYKAKFAPIWEPRFIAGPQGLSMARAMVDLRRLVGGGRASATSRMSGSGRMRAMEGAGWS
ncbi:bifunctional lysylphosphatidylglycerol flippase/synthetase MprF [Sphingobium lactosutens]|uniref:bifunctional lysylphosphatidylglycerol flippase/synthetase MprF n=1 Tax=Sphingobium lactosutens TaxID=522773 RepID=UPI0015BA5D19|nr:bifunctional lysylphosphatidylglycerol flippase/synthetase MprF [Sphingobium lactosutens]NWK97571.1 bifunctional lysylphosphatidylglycerol flippase/synthetase MprF [Sphingobium lactosutens]